MIGGGAAVRMPEIALQAKRPTKVQPDPATLAVKDGAVGGRAADRETRHYVIALLAIIVALLVAVEGVLLRDGAGWDVTTLLYWESMVVLYFTSGLLAAWRQPHNRFGLLMIWTGLTIWCAGLESVPYPGIALIGDVTKTLPLAAVVHLVMAYPHGRLPDRLSRMVVATIYTVALVLQAPSYLFASGSAFMIAGVPALGDPFRSLQRVIGLVGLCVALWVVLRRRSFADPVRRHRLGPLAWYGPVALIALIVDNFVGYVLGMFPHQVGNIQIAIVLGLPILFLAGLLTGYFGRAGELREFLARVGGDLLQPEELDFAVARALGDHSARVVYGAGPPGGYFYDDGSAVRTEGRRVVMPVHYGADIVGAIIYDADSVIDDRILAEVARVCALAVDHHRVVAVLRAALLEVERSAVALRQAQYRLVQASDVERRRIARDLHDGVQQDIVVLGLQVRSLDRGADDPDVVRATAVDLQSGMSDLLADFRALVHGIMPASLTDRGIDSAIRELGERTALPLIFRSSGIGHRLPEAIESTVYFVILETVTNAIKHASATGIWVELRYDDGVLRAEIRDDGRGGITALDGGGGLAGLRDRVLALNGSLTVSSPPGNGTVVRALIPCG